MVEEGPEDSVVNKKNPRLIIYLFAEIFKLRVDHLELTLQ